MTVTVYVPCDSSAIALGADDVAQAITQQAQQRGVAINLKRNGSRGMFSLEPLVEVATPNGRIAYGPVDVDDVASLFDADFLNGGAHKLLHGLTEQIPFLKNQERLTFMRIGVTDPVSIEDYLAHEGYVGLRRAITLSAPDIVQEVLDSGLRGRGGAAFPTGIKWKTVLNTASATKYVVCNADEGDSGTFSDRMVMENDPLMLIEGMTIAGIAVGATQGYIYVRSEYPHAIAALNKAIQAAYANGFLGRQICGSGFHFDLEVRKGAGSYVCGISDLGKNQLNFVNRQKGSGTRMLLELILAKNHIDPNQINGYDTTELTHSAVAAFIASGMAEVGFGVQTAAQRFGLDFIPLVRERYFLALSLAALNDPVMQHVISVLQSAEYREEVNRLAGYDATETGKILSISEIFNR